MKTQAGERALARVLEQANHIMALHYSTTPAAAHNHPLYKQELHRIVEWIVKLIELGTPGTNFA